MRWQRLTVTALALLLLAGRGSLTAADQPAAKPQDRLEAMADKLGLSAEQKEKVRKIHADYDQKEDKLEAESRKLRQEEMEAGSKVLTDEQRAKAKELLKADMENELKEVADKLGLSGEQRQKLAKIRAEYDEKIHRLEGQHDEKAAAEVRELRGQEFQAMRKELTEDQQAKVPGILREELREWRDPAEMGKRMHDLLEKVDLSAEQKEKLGQVRAEYGPKIGPLEAQLRALHRDERAEVDKVLTDEQRAKLRDLLKARAGANAPK